MAEPSITHLERSKIEAGVLIRMVHAFQRAIARERANEIAREVIFELMRKDGERWAQQKEGRAVSENWSLRVRMRMLSLVNTTKTTKIDLTTWCGDCLMGKILFDVNFPGAALCLVVSLVFACVLMESAIPASETPYLPLEPPAAEPQEPITPIPLSLALDPQRVALGDRLFHDVRLSHDNTRACTMCHPLQRGGMDGQSHASAANGTAPYFHDGRAPTLEGAVETMARVQLGRTLTPEEIGLIVQFLHTLTGEYHGRPVATSVQEHSDGYE